MGSRLNYDQSDGYGPWPTVAHDHPDDLEPQHMPETPPPDWTELEEQIRLPLVPYCRLKLLNSYTLTRRIIELSVRAHQLKNVKNPEFVRK